MSDKKNNIPNVLGDKLALGLARSSFREHEESKPKPLAIKDFEGKKSLSSRFDVFVKDHVKHCGEGLVRLIRTNKGKKEEVETISAFFGGQKPCILFNREILHARGMIREGGSVTKLSKTLPVLINEHAIQRCIQSLHSTDLGVLSKELFMHYEAVLNLPLNKQKIYTMTESGMCIWSVCGRSHIVQAVSEKLIDDNLLKYIGDDELFYVCRTYIGADYLDGHNSVRRQRWAKRLNYQ